jgi:chemotaxis response regulator CheB
LFSSHWTFFAPSTPLSFHRVETTSLDEEKTFFKAMLGDSHKIHGQWPAVDVLFDSASQRKHAKILAALFTRMEPEGGFGLLNLNKVGAFEFTQSESSSVVYGTHKYACELGDNQMSGSPETFSGLLVQKFRS